MTSTPPGYLLRQAAMTFANRGWPVLPTDGKIPRTPNGVRDATTEPTLIQSWWNRWPTAGIGLSCGGLSRLLVVDLDGPDATAAWRDLTGEHGGAVATRTARTGRPDGGWHLYYSHPAGRDRYEQVGNSAGLLGPGIDVRGRGGYVIAPPSPHPSGALYTWHIPDGATRPLPVAAAPTWLLDALTDDHSTSATSTPRAGSVSALPGAPVPAAPQRYLDAAVRGEADRVAAAVEGTRNHTLNRAAFALAGLGIPEQVIRERLTHAAHDAGLDAREIDRTLTSGISAGHRHPRQAVTLTPPAATGAASPLPTPATPPTAPPTAPLPASRAAAGATGQEGHPVTTPTTAPGDTGPAGTPPASTPPPSAAPASAAGGEPLDDARPGDTSSADGTPTDAIAATSGPGDSAADRRPPGGPGPEAGADRVAQLRAWSSRTGQGTTLPVDQVAGFGPGRAPASLAAGTPGAGSALDQATAASPRTAARGISIPRQASRAAGQAVSWHRTADALTSLAHREADPQRAAATREHADVARRISTAMGREHVARVTADGGSFSPSGRQPGARSGATTHDTTSHETTSHDRIGDQGGGQPPSRLLERTAAPASAAQQLDDAGGFDAAAQPDAAQAWRAQATGHDADDARGDDARALVEHDVTSLGGGWVDVEDHYSDAGADTGGGVGVVGW